MPTDRTIYPPDWEQRAERIKSRAGYRCESCGLGQYWHVYSLLRKDTKRREWFVNYRAAVDRAVESGWIREVAQRYYIKTIKVVLTVHHLNHDPGNWDVKDDQLEALCQKCHLRQHKKKTDARQVATR